MFLILEKAPYKPAPSNVVHKNGEYFTKGTEGGLGNKPDEESEETEIIEEEQEQTNQPQNSNNNSIFFNHTSRIICTNLLI